MKQNILEAIYILAGVIAIITAIHAYNDKKHPARLGTTLFWIVLGVIFIFGKIIPSEVVGALILVMGIITGLKQVRPGTRTGADDQTRMENAKRMGNKLFIPALTIGIVAFIFGQFIKSLGGLVGLGVASILAIIIARVMTKVDPKRIPEDTSRLLLQIGATAILPQLLTALGALFAAAGVGEVISEGIKTVLPQNNILLGVIAYCLGMALFTMIMGNAFAAFTVITTGVGIPFVLAHGGNPAVVGALALTAGYCGTLMTPMAANFNIIPAAVLETKNKYAVIMAQLPFALVLWVIHVILMYTLAF